MKYLVEGHNCTYEKLEEIFNNCSVNIGTKELAKKEKIYQMKEIELI
ncbi:hypothetical protein [Romboutsia lituseburensis]|nr:hypothetical protein [Romboutsia lituseburensis]MCR8743905.1 hypothetical protein [Romboutsia lituseburensis]